jgi:predicted phosphodiesterase
MDASLEIAGRRIFLVHYPHYARAMATTGDWDLVCCGHTHKVSIEERKNCKGGMTHLVNPGTIGGVGKDRATYIMADLDAMTFEVHDIPKSIEHQAING